MISQEQENQIKKQIIGQIESSFPEDKKNAAIQQVNSMNSEQLVEFLEKNNLIKTQPSENPEGQQCIFCSIVSEKIPSYKIDESKNAIAVLEVNPISKAHVLIIPKKHSLLKKIPKNISSFLEKTSKRIKSKFKPKEILTAKANLFGHEIINLIPVYKNENLDSKRYEAKKEELEEGQKILTRVKKQKVKIPKAKKINEKNLWLPRRIP